MRHLISFRTILLLAVLMAGTAIAWVQWQRSAVLPDDGSLRIVTFGTSLSATERWQPQLRAALETCLKSPVSVVNISKVAMASPWGVSNAWRVGKANPAIVIIEFAINDPFPAYGISLADSRRNTTRIVTTIRAKAPSASIFLMTTSPDFTGERARLADYYAQYREIAAEQKVGLIDLFPLWQKATSGDEGQRLLPDRLHPTREAYDEVVLPTLIRAVSGGRCGGS